MPIPFRLFTLLAFCTSAFSSTLPSERQRILDLAGRGEDYLGRREDLVFDASLTEDELSELGEDSDWRVRVHALAVLAWRKEPAHAAETWEVVPRSDRAGIARFLGHQLLSDEMAPVAMERLLHGHDPASIRAALVEAIVQTRMDWDEALVDRLAQEPEPVVREAIVHSLWRAEGNLSLRGVSLGLKDQDARVRSEAARTAARIEEGRSLITNLLKLLEDREPEPRAMAARSLGILRAKEAWSPLLRCLSDEDAEVRLQAFHALERLDPKNLSLSTEMDVLLSDPDPRVRRAAERLRNR